MLQSIYFWILTGALGLFFGMSNPLLHVPFAVLLYPASLYMLSKISKNPFRDGTLCGLIGASLCMYWISVAVYFYGGFPWVFAVPCAIAMGMYIGLWGGLFSFVMQRVLSLNLFLRVIIAALFWYICEWLRSFLFTGFSWITLSSAFAPIPELIQGASLIGAFGLSGIFAGIGILLAEAFISSEFSKEIQASYVKSVIYRGLRSFGAVLLVVLLFVYGDMRLESSFQDNAFLRGVDTAQPYISIEEITIPVSSANPSGIMKPASVVSADSTTSAGSVDLAGSAASVDSTASVDLVDLAGSAASVDLVDLAANSLNYQESHKNPQMIGSAKHVIIIPNFLDVVLKDNEDAASVQIRNGTLVPKKFFEQEDIVLFMVVQGNVSQAVKWDKSFQFSTVQKYIRLSTEASNFVESIFPFVNFRSESFSKYTDPMRLLNPLMSSDPLTKQINPLFPFFSIPAVTLLPETALPFYFQQASPLSSMVKDFAKDKKIIFGAPGLDLDAHAQGVDILYNRLFFLQGDKLSHYDKEHLVPFGESVPDLPLLPEMFSNLLQGIGGFTEGKNDKLLMLTRYENDEELSMVPEDSNTGQKAVQDGANTREIRKMHPLSPLICYEAIFPQRARRDVKKGAELFVNVSNDAWYNKTSAAEQHLYLSLMRSVEQKRFLVRAGNTGISAFIDDYGRIMGKSSLFTDETLSGFVVFRTEKTIYYHLAPRMPFIALFLFLMLFIYAQILRVRFQKVRTLERVRNNNGK